jgi:hypothetical protein
MDTEGPTTAHQADRACRSCVSVAFSNYRRQTSALQFRAAPVGPGIESAKDATDVVAVARHYRSANPPDLRAAWIASDLHWKRAC